MGAARCKVLAGLAVGCTVAALLVLVGSRMNAVGIPKTIDKDLPETRRDLMTFKAVSVLYSGPDIGCKRGG